jgi:hypothetical protein
MLELIRGASRSTEEAAYELAVLRLHSLEKQGNVVSEDERKDGELCQESDPDREQSRR